LETALSNEDLIGYLASKGIQVRRANGAEIVIHCPFCEENKRSPKLYINGETWLYDCKLCGANGNRRTLMRHFGDEEVAEIDTGMSAFTRRRVLQKAADLAHELLLQNDEQVEYLLERGLSPETIRESCFGYVPKNYGFTHELHDKHGFTVSEMIDAGVLNEYGNQFFNHTLVIPYFHHKSVVQLRAKELYEDGHYRTAGGENVRLYNEDALQGAERALVVEGEFDCKILEQTLHESGDPVARSIAVVGLPGAGAQPDRFDRYFTQTRRLYCGFDPDKAGRAGAARVRENVGSQVRIVELPPEEPKCDWNEYLRDKTPEHPHGGHGWRDVMALLARADLVGKRVFSVGEARSKWNDDRTNNPGIKLGWLGIDSRIKPGLRPGQVMIPLAKTGTGKTAWLANVAHNTRSHRTLFISLELTAVELFEMLRRIHFFWNPTAPPHQVDYDYGNLRIFDENRLSHADLTTVVAEYTEDVGAPPELVMIDYLGYYARSFVGDNYTRTSDAVMQLKAEAKSLSVPIITPAQVNRGAKEGQPLEVDVARDSGVIEETGDFVLSLYRPDQAVGADELTGALNMQLLKSRHGGKGQSANTRFSYMSLAMVETHDQKNSHRIQMENDAYRRGVDYETFRKSAGTEQLSVVR
jgi:hypothetical protein